MGDVDVEARERRPGANSSATDGRCGGLRSLGELFVGADAPVMTTSARLARLTAMGGDAPHASGDGAEGDRLLSASSLGFSEV